MNTCMYHLGKNLIEVTIENTEFGRGCNLYISSGACRIKLKMTFNRPTDTLVHPGG